MGEFGVLGGCGHGVVLRFDGLFVHGMFGVGQIAGLFE